MSQKIGSFFASFFLMSFITVLALFCYFEISQKKEVSKEYVVQAISDISNFGFEVTYNNLKITQNPSQTELVMSDLEFMNNSNKLSAIKAQIAIKTNSTSLQSFVLDMQDIKINDNISIKSMQIASQKNNSIHKNPSFESFITLDGITVNGINFNQLSIQANNIGKRFSIPKLTLTSNVLGLSAQGEGFINSKDDIGFSLNSSSTGLLETLDSLEKTTFLQGKGVYVTKLVLGTQNSSNIITPIELKNKELLIKNIVIK